MKKIKSITRHSTQKHTPAPRAPTKWKKAILSNAVALAGAGLGASGAIGASCPVGSGTRTMVCNLTGTDSATISTNGSIQVTGSSAINVDDGSSNVTITNDGTVSASTAGSTAAGIAADYDFNGTISNTGTISGEATYSAAGIYVNSTFTAGSTLTNSGSITGTADYYAYGVNFYDDLDGTVTNNVDGMISGVAEGSSSATAYGILAYYNLSTDASITNHGTISGSALATGTYTAEAYGIYVDDYMEGIINNTGTISALATGTGSAAASAYGIYLSSTMFSGSQLTNSGTISAQADSENDWAYAVGVFSYDIQEGASISNTDTGSISGAANGAEATAYGIYLDSYVYGTVSNAGTVTATATANTSAAQAYAIYADSTIYATGQILNSGTITATATSTDSWAETVGIWSYYGLEGGLIENSGDITSTASGTSASAWGIYFSSDLDIGSTLTNSGSISASATATSSEAEAVGVYIYDMNGASFTNTDTGSITVTATGDYGTATGVQVYSTLDADSSVTNAGTITVSVTAATESATAYGIYIDDYMEGTIDNSGTISVTANGETYATAEGIYLESGMQSGSRVTNSGSISATATDAMYDTQTRGIFVDYMEDDTVLTNTAAGAITASSTGPEAEASGIEVNSMGYAGASIVNDGTITATTVSSGDSADARGMHIDGYMAGSITSSGSINATATGNSAEAQGILIHSTIIDGGSVNNSGSISATANGAGPGSNQTSEATRAVGIDVYVMEDGSSLTNSGSITASASATDNVSPTIAGIYIGTLNAGATVNNRGTVTVAPAEDTFSLYVDMGMGGSISNSGRLDGDLHLHGTSLDNTGTVAIPVGVNGFIDGDYTQSAGGQYELGLESSAVGDYGTLTVAGTADLTASGSLAVAVSPDDGLVDDEVVEDVLSAGTLLTGDLSVTDDSLFWDFTALDDGANHIDLVVDRALLVEEAVRATGPSWALGAAATLDDIIEGAPQGDMADVIDEMGSLGSEEEISAVAAQTVPVIVGQSAQMANLSLDNITNSTIKRIASSGGMASGDELMSDQHLWIRPFGSQAEQDDQDGVPGYDADRTGLIIGYDHALNSEWTIGGAIGYAQTEVDDNSPLLSHNLDVDSIQLAGYADWQLGNDVFVNLIAAIGTSETDSERNISFANINRTAEGSYDSLFARLYSAVGRDYTHGKVTLTPVVSAAYTYIDEDSYNESGAGSLNLSVDSNDAEALVVGLDGRVAYELNHHGSLVTAHAGIGYDALTDEATLTSTFEGGGPAFRTSGPEPDDVILQAGVGVEFHTSDRLDVFFSYEYESRDDFENQLLTGTVRWAF